MVINMYTTKAFLMSFELFLDIVTRLVRVLTDFSKVHFLSFDLFTILKGCIFLYYLMFPLFSL